MTDQNREYYTGKWEKPADFCILDIKTESPNDLFMEKPVCECFIGNTNKYCMSKSAEDKIVKKYGSIENAILKLNVGSLIDLIRYVDVLNKEEKESELKMFKIVGEKSTDLMSNVIIDKTLERFNEILCPDFFPYNFNMVGFNNKAFRRGIVLNEPDTLATISPYDLYLGNEVTKDGKVYKHKFTMAGCIINSDTYDGNGKHWMALFVDMRGKKWTIEFFNSSGNYPVSEWSKWMLKTKDSLLKLNKYVEIKNVCLKHQFSRSECGVYSIYYIWSRICGVSYEYFMKNKVSDYIMFEFRQHMFSDKEFTSTYNKNLFIDFCRIMREKIHEPAFADIKKLMNDRSLEIEQAFNDNVLFCLILLKIREMPEFKKFYIFDKNIFEISAKVKWE